MDRESVDRLKFDRRLALRRGWVEESDYASYIESLADVSDKMTTAAELEAEDAAAPAPAVESPVAEQPAFAEQTPTPAFSAPAPRPPGGVAGDFSSSSTLGGGTSIGYGSSSDDSTES
jgi:hypothetical protein